jgi:solute carrier family 6 (neurotransmitter transporter, glycine) member 5/9
MNWNLFVFLLISWVLVFLIVVKGIQSSGKFSYILAIFPYILLFILLIKSLTLEGALEGISYFFYPKWEEIIKPKVWYEATTQIFFSLGPFFGMTLSYASYNKFDQKSHIHAHIVTTIDTFTSILAGSCVFAVLGHLKHELGVADMNDVIKSGFGMVKRLMKIITLLR